MTRTARLKAFAKLNLGLRVLSKRPDGYHELRTVFQTISLADELEVSFRRARRTGVRVTGTPEIADNLVAKAAHLVLEELKIQADIEFHLKKKIPMGAGLGGGSSDAAAVLLAIPVLAQKNMAEERLFGIAQQLGSDVPFFLWGGTALGIGRGEEVYPLPDQPGRRGLLVAPAIHSSTAEAYRDLSAQLTLIGLQNKLFTFRQQIWRGAGAVYANDFEEVVFARYPELRRVKRQLMKAGANAAAMTGSGSAIFGLFSDPATLERARNALRSERAFPFSFVSRARYRSVWRRALMPHAVIPQSQLELKGDQWPPRSPYAQ